MTTRINRGLRPLFWTTAATLIAAEGLAFWVVCSHQMDRAAARRLEVQVTQVAFNDCLAYVPKSTIASCRRQVTARP